MSIEITRKFGQNLMKFTVADEKEAFEQIGHLYEIFSHSKCGCCGSENVTPQCRVKDKYRYYEVACKEPGCYAKLAFGQKQEGGELFPKRRNEDGSYKENDGWEKYQKPEQEQSAPTKPNFQGNKKQQPQTSGKRSAPPIEYEGDAPF
jgi:hypothetical protein